MYSIVKDIVLDDRVEGAIKRDVVIVDRINGRELQNKMHQMSIGCRGQWTVFNYNANVIKCLKILEVEEDKKDHKGLFKSKKEKVD